MAKKMRKKGDNKEVVEKKEFGKLDAQEKQIRIILVIIAAVIVLVIVAFFYRNSLNNFNYKGIDFKKTYEGDIPFYTAQLPMKNDYGAIVGYDSFDFRNDPRKLKDIAVNVGDKIGFKTKDRIYVSTRTDIDTCQGDLGLALIGNGRLLARFGLDVKGALDDPDYKNNTKSPYVNCETNKNNTVILVKQGNETKIQRTGENCYEIIFKDCEVLRAVEKFELAIIEQVYGDSSKN